MVEPEHSIIDARAAISTYAIWVTISGFLFVLYLFTNLGATPKILLGSISALTLLWIRAYRIIFDGRTITYRTLFGGTKSIELASITSARTEVGTKDRLGPMFRLVLEGSGASGEPPIVINMKPFKREDLQRLSKILEPKMVGHPRLQIFGKPKHCD